MSANDSNPAVSQPNYFWVGEYVLQLLAGDGREGEVKRLIDAETVEVDWFSGDWRGLKTEKERDLRLDPTSTSNRNPYRIGDLVKNVSGKRFKVTRIWDKDVVQAEDASGGNDTYQIQVIHLSPCGTTGDNVKLRASRKDRAAASGDPLVACPKCNAVNDRCTVIMLRELNRGQNRPIDKLCESCQELSPFADWLHHNGTS